ncbi:MAG: alkaline phosphatase PhoX [Thermaurantimonas sp.]|uniref:alkaline phosphatase PhoX n=1 Tax=Thermaurantimonas sp. TaxID=2681568 RepID=UPI003918C7B7
MKKVVLSACIMASFFQMKAQGYQPFTPLNNVDTAGSVQVRVGSSLQMKVVFREGSNFVRVNRADGVTATVPAPREHDFMAYIPDAQNPNTKGTLVINHERRTILNERPQLGWGGAMSVVPVIKDPQQGWIIDQTRTAGGDTCWAVDFSTVGWTTTNCGGALLPNGMVLTGEEIFANYTSNFQIRNWHDTAATTNGYDGQGNYTIPTNVPEFGGQKIKAWQNFGWLTMIDPNTKKAVRKLYHAGRMSFEGTIAMPDNRTLIHGNDFVPASNLPHGAFIWKYVADSTGDYTKGNLYVFKQNPGSYKGQWIQIPRHIDSLINAPAIATRLGATAFQRIEWTEVDPTTGKVYLAETGRDNQPMGPSIRAGVTIPRHWIDNNFFSFTDSVCRHPFGAVLVLEDALTNEPSVKPYLLGGPEVPGKPAESRFVFNSVDGIEFVQFGNKRYLLLQEDNIGTSLGRIVPNFFGSFPYEIPKAFLLDLDIPNPTPANLLFLMTGTRDAEFTGGVFTPDGSTLFINNQHPDGTGGSLANDQATSSMGNVYPFQRATTIAVTGFKNQGTINIPEIESADAPFRMHPNPTFNAVHFNKIVDFELLDATGRVIMVRENMSHINLYGLKPGMYFLRLKDGSVHKIQLIQ